ncbi:MAG: DoxX family protein [Clostridia bacterium]|nr:DoxX family protein [Clostridia bacterium]MCL6521407.1 DoxX family protein [Bacillota bacterium]
MGVMRLFRDRAYSWIWLLLRVYVGWQWLVAGWEKLHEDVWVGAKAGTAITGFWTKGAGLLVGPDGKPVPGSAHWWYRDFLHFLINIHAGPAFSYFIVGAELLVGLGLIFGFLTPIAAAGGALMNLNFMLAGSSSSNGWLYTLALLILVAGTNAGYLGVDRWLWPRLFGRREEAEAARGEAAG